MALLSKLPFKQFFPSRLSLLLFTQLIPYLPYAQKREKSSEAKQKKNSFLDDGKYSPKHHLTNSIPHLTTKFTVVVSRASDDDEYTKNEKGMQAENVENLCFSHDKSHSKRYTRRDVHGDSFPVSLHQRSSVCDPSA